MYNKPNTNYLSHHGIKGQQWGVRRFQYADGSLTNLGQKRRNVASMEPGLRKLLAEKKLQNEMKRNTKIANKTGKQTVDGFVDKNATLNRIQTATEFGQYAFFATYNKDDSDKYLGLFGANLKSRIDKEAKAAESKAKRTNDPDDIAEAERLRSVSDGTKVYQLSINAQKRLKVPSDNNAGDVLIKTMMKDNQFMNDVKASIEDSKGKMLRPSQQMLFKQSENIMKKDLNTLTDREKTALYKAFNLSLVHHNDYENRAQDRFYGELKKKGYSALLDYNDKEFSSYHAHRPMIVFDTAGVRLDGMKETNQQVAEKMNVKYNAERARKETAANTIGIVKQYAGIKITECESAMKAFTMNYLERE